MGFLYGPLFEPVRFDQLPVEIQEQVNRLKIYSGSKLLVARNGEKYLFIGAGPQPNPGYGLIIRNMVRKRDRLIIYVQITLPDPNKMYIQVISYPFIVGRVSPVINYVEVIGLPNNSKLDR